MIAVPDHSPLLGKEFAYGGRGPETFDCWGLVLDMYRRAGVMLPDHPSHDDPAVQGPDIQAAAETEWIPVAEPQPMDVLLFQVLPRWVTHCGLYLGSGRFLHILRRTRVSVECLDDAWRQRLRGSYRPRGLA